ncbi:bacteriocin immunity protein [Pseudomonas sp. xss_2]|uniref:bacteriocin immunity protein n=1 Tax=Pseudomonas sp. xss_2 TaxID=3367215 RepID=UPI00370A9520
MSKTITDYTESDFLEFVTNIYLANYPTERAQINAVIEFERISEHPSGSDLLYYPEEGKDGPTHVVSEVKAWRIANEKTGFKPE